MNWNTEDSSRPSTASTVMPRTLLPASHLAGGSLAILGGLTAMFTRKDDLIHRSAGTLFVYAMILMGIAANRVALERGRPTAGWAASSPSIT